MTYATVDAIQRALAQTVFGDRKDTKKAAGRALGTIVELITFYIFREWGLLTSMTIERAVPEFGNPSISHNVEFGIHPLESIAVLDEDIKLPISATKIIKACNSKSIQQSIYINPENGKKTNQLLSSTSVQRNCCLIADQSKSLYVANLKSYSQGKSEIIISKLRSEPYAIVECKRVGIEEGQTKGPTTIEKAKQGAYVARQVTALQKIRSFDGTLYGVMPLKEGGFEIYEHLTELKRLVKDARPDELDGFILTIGIVSNHGNWFTSENMNKELLVLKQSYDWLLFLTDQAIAEFITSTILSNDEANQDIRKAFEDSYASSDTKANQFTKVKITLEAHKALTRYFNENIDKIESSWFNVISPVACEVKELKDELYLLKEKFNQR